jgi:uncharacterized protein YjbJ (UPF0337 family)
MDRCRAGEERRLRGRRLGHPWRKPVNRQEMKGNWRQLKGRARETWGRLTDDDLDQIAGRRQVLIGRIQERYGKDLATAEEEVDTWLDRLESHSTP